MHVYMCMYVTICVCVCVCSVYLSNMVHIDWIPMKKFVKHESPI